MLMIADDKKHIEDIEGFENAYLGENFYTSLIWWYDFNCVNHVRSLSYKV